MEYSSMSERILRSIENILNNDPDLEDFTIVPTEDNTKNRSPVLYEDHHLGLESWCVKYVYQFVCSEIFKVRESLASRKMGHSKKENLNYLLMGALFINPDVNTFWNMRRELLESDVLDYEQELRLSKLVLTRKNKSNEAFAYRRWLLKRILEKMSKNGVSPPSTLLETELTVSYMTAVNSQNNYHSWTHRIWCMDQFLRYFPESVTSELNFSEKWISEHVSENTGYHYRQYLIGTFKNCDFTSVLGQYFEAVIKKLNLMSDGEPTQLIVFLLGKSNKNKYIENAGIYINYVCLLLYELLVVIDNINMQFTEHESLFLHRRFIVYHLLQLCHEYQGNTYKSVVEKIRFSNNASFSTKNIIGRLVSDDGESQAKIFKGQPSKIENCNLYKILLDSEKSFVSKNSGGSPVQEHLAKRHEKWLKFLVGMDLAG